MIQAQATSLQSGRLRIEFQQAEEPQDILRLIKRSQLFDSTIDILVYIDHFNLLAVTGLSHSCISVYHLDSMQVAAQVGQAPVSAMCYA